MKAEDASPLRKTSFLKDHLLPLVFVFLIPGFSLWFFNYAEDDYDQSVRENVLAEISADTSISESERARISENYANFALSEIFASSDPALDEMKGFYGPAAKDYAMFRWAKRISLVCLVVLPVAFLLVGLSVLYSLKSQAAQYRALKLGWPFLKIIAVIEVIGQGVLAVGLSYWITAIWFEIYVVKLIALIGALAAIGIVVLVKAIFAKPDDTFHQTGELHRRVRRPRPVEARARDFLPVRHSASRPDHRRNRCQFLRHRARYHLGETESRRAQPVRQPAVVRHPHR